MFERYKTAVETPNIPWAKRNENSILFKMFFLAILKRYTLQDIRFTSTTSSIQNV
jgi:hypothetical protein